MFAPMPPPLPRRLAAGFTDSDGKHLIIWMQQNLFELFLRRQKHCYWNYGGVANNLSMIDPEKSIDDNIVRLFFRTDGYLYDETRNLLTQEFSDISTVNNIVEQIASGENTLNTIAGKQGKRNKRYCIP